MKCGNCNIDFSSKTDAVRHNMDVHRSTTVDGSEDLQAIQTKLSKDDKKYADLVARRKAETE